MAAPAPSSDRASTLRILENSPLTPAYSRLRVWVNTMRVQKPARIDRAWAMTATVIFLAEYSVLLFSSLSGLFNTKSPL